MAVFFYTMVALWVMLATLPTSSKEYSVRKIATFETQSEADQFRHYLQAENIETSTREDEPLEVWVLHDDDLFRSKSLHSKFIANPQDHELQRKISDGRIQAAQLKAAAAKAQRQQAKQQRQASQTQSAPVTKAMLGICLFFFLSYLIPPTRIFVYLAAFPMVESLSHIPIWRWYAIVTPIFLHFDWLHILFNLYWLYLLGPLVENHLSSRKMIAMVIFIAFTSHTIFFWVMGPRFIGMSGVIYGFLGFMWIQERLAGRSLSMIGEDTYRFFVIWHIICWFLSALGMLPVANTIHGVGAFAGIVFGFFIGGYWKKMQVNEFFSKKSFYNFAILFCLMIGGIVADYYSYGP